MSKSNKLYVFYGTSGGGIGNISEVARMPIATKQIGHDDTPAHAGRTTLVPAAKLAIIVGYTPPSEHLTHFWPW